MIFPQSIFLPEVSDQGLVMGPAGDGPTAEIGSLVTDTSHIIQACHSGYRQTLTQNQDTKETKGFIYQLWYLQPITSFNSYNIADCSFKCWTWDNCRPPINTGPGLAVSDSPAGWLVIDNSLLMPGSHNVSWLPGSQAKKVQRSS